jgi:integration host factor subunit beta
MTRSELIQRLAEKHPDLPVAKLEAAVKFLLEHLRETLVEGERIEVRGFGSFSIRTSVLLTGTKRLRLCLHPY